METSTINGNCSELQYVKLPEGKREVFFEKDKMEVWFVVVLLMNVPLDDVGSLDMVCSNDFFSTDCT